MVHQWEIFVTMYVMWDEAYMELQHHISQILSGFSLQRCIDVQVPDDWTGKGNAKQSRINTKECRVMFVSFWSLFYNDDVIKWKHVQRCWPFVRGIHRSPVNSPHKGQWRGALTFSLICAWINRWVNNGEDGDLRRYRTHYDVIVMIADMVSWQPRPGRKWVICVSDCWIVDGYTTFRRTALTRNLSATPRLRYRWKMWRFLLLLNIFQVSTGWQN